MKIFLNKIDMQGGHEGRGIGVYTRLLERELSALENVELVESAEAADLIHYPTFDLFFPTLPFRGRKPKVVTIHDVIPLEFKNHYPVGVKGMINHWRQSLSLARVKKVITDSTYSAEMIEQHLGVKRDKIAVVGLASSLEPSLVESILAQPDLEERIAGLRAKYQLPARYLLYVGDINYNKNLPALIEALSSLPKDLGLAMVGKNIKPQAIPEWRAIEQALSKLAGDDAASRVVMINDLPGSEAANLVRLYHGAAAYVQPSLSEGFGLPVLEAMACQTPVVATRAGSLPEVVGDFGLLANPTPTGLSQAINHLLLLPDYQRQRLVEAAADWAATFSWQETARQTAAVYQEVLGQS